jgi:hypothetical protein
MKDRYCPWCDRKYQAESNKGGPLCDECREELMEQPREFLVGMLGHLADLNALAIAALRASPHLLEEFGLAGSGPEEADGTRRKLTLKELAKSRQRAS